MRIFFSAGEPSGDLHGANLIRALRQRDPELDCYGFGGDKMADAGCRLVYPLCQLSVMWLLRVALNIHVFLGLLSRADRIFRHQRPDAVVLIDYPGFNWWLARRAHFHGIPVYYYVPPQLWAWASWRVSKMRRWVTHVLCSLPFEEAWYRERGVAADYIGHPYFDELAQQQLAEEFVTAQQRQAGPVVALLPGSRNQELDRNLSTLIRAAQRVHAARPDVRFLVACFKEEHRKRIAAYVRGRGLPIEVHTGRTPEIIHLAHACLAVSGSVGLELLYRGKPSVVLYRVRPLELRIGHFFKTSPYISLVNMLAGKELFPEYLTDRCEAEALSNQVLHWLDDEPAYQALCGELGTLRRQVGAAGACGRAASFLLEALAGKGNKRIDRAA